MKNIITSIIIISTLSACGGKATVDQEIETFSPEPSCSGWHEEPRDLSLDILRGGCQSSALYVESLSELGTVSVDSADGCRVKIETISQSDESCPAGYTDRREVWQLTYDPDTGNVEGIVNDWACYDSVNVAGTDVCSWRVD